jgi:hypothetical protein
MDEQQRINAVYRSVERHGNGNDSGERNDHVHAAYDM